jgi:hypothetical protein
MLAKRKNTDRTKKERTKDEEKEPRMEATYYS